MTNGSSESLKEVKLLIKEAFEKEEKDDSTSNASWHGVSVKDLDLKDGKKTFRPLTTRIEVLKEWKVLVEALEKANVFLQYLPGLRTSLLEIEHINSTEYRHLRALVGLLAHTVENHYRDNSTECRFVTLLEVMLTYGRQWVPSAAVSRFWVRLMQRIPDDTPPVNFRRKAYRVLVSLSWVPSSKGLLEACSFEENRQHLDHEGAPPGVKALLARIKNRPLPRYDCVNQLLDRLKDETDVCVAINSEKEGGGKTILAALVSSHPSILRVFSVLWLTVKDQPLTYENYIEYLNELCEQVGSLPKWPEAIKRFEEPALRRLRDQQRMKQARQLMSEILLRMDENILLILDDVSDARDASLIEWFRFNERQSIIVTTPDRELEGVDWTVLLDPMSEEEAIELFLMEADFPAAHVVGSTEEVRSIIKQCECNPLNVRTVARWYRLKQVTASIVQGMEEIQNGLANFKADQLASDAESEDDERESPPMLFDVLSLLMGPSTLEGNSTSAVFVLCLASLAVVFPDKAPLDAVLLLWAQVLRVESLAIDELAQNGSPPESDYRKHAWFISEGLIHMGVISVADKDDGKNPWVEIHHKLYRQFAMFMAKEMDLAKTFEKTSEEWNKAFVTAYFTERIQGDSTKADDNSWEYAIEKLPHHMLLAKMLPLVETILSDENFFRARIEVIGWERAIDAQVQDCVMLQRALEKDFESSADSSLKVSPVFSRTAAMVATHAEGVLGCAEVSFVVEVSRGLYKIGFALAENGYFGDAITQFDNAQNLLPQSQSLRASILYGAGWAALAINESEKALKKIKASKKVMDESEESHVLYREVLLLQGDALFAQCEYKEAAACFDQLVYLLGPADADSLIELGTTLHKKGRLHHIMGDLEAAKTALNECVKWKLDIGEVSRNLSLTYSALGDIYMELRELSESRENYENALQTLERLKYQPDHIDHLLLTGKLRFLRSDFAGCFQALELARSAIVEAPLLLMDQSAYDLRCVAQRYQGRGNLDNAIKVLHESLLLTNNRPYSLERSSALLELGNCLLDKGQIEEGLISLEQSLEIRILKLGECMQVLETFKTIGNVHLSVGSFDEALKVFTKVLELTERISPDDVERIAGVVFSIAETYDAKDDFGEAVVKFNESIEILKRKCSADHPDIAKALHRLGDVMVVHSDLEKASEYYFEALRIRRMSFDEKLVAETLHSLGVLTRRLGEVEPAKNYLEDALEIRRKFNDIDRDTAETLLEVGNCYRLLSEPENALSLYEKALDVLPENDELFGTVYLAMGHGKLFLGQFSEALLFYDKAREILLAAHGKDDILTGNSSRSLGLVKYLLNRGEEALVHLNEFVRVCELAGDEESESVDYILAVMLLGDIYTVNLKTEQAKNVYAVAKEIWEDDEEVQLQVPALFHMIERRTGNVPVNSVERGSGFLSKVKDRLSEEVAPTFQLNLDPAEVEILQKIAFLDE